MSQNHLDAAAPQCPECQCQCGGSSSLTMASHFCCCAATAMYHHSILKPPQQYPVEQPQQKPVEQPLEVDILCGQDRKYAKHNGNKLFKAQISLFVDEYEIAETKQTKMRMTRKIVDRMKSLYNSRFLRLVEKGVEYSYWTEISDQQAREKTSHALRFEVKKRERKQSSNKKIKKTARKKRDSLPLVTNHEHLGNIEGKLPFLEQRQVVQSGTSDGTTEFQRVSTATVMAAIGSQRVLQEEAMVTSGEYLSHHHLDDTDYVGTYLMEQQEKLMSQLESMEQGNESTTTDEDDNEEEEEESSSLDSTDDEIDEKDDEGGAGPGYFQEHQDDDHSSDSDAASSREESDDQQGSGTATNWGNNTSNGDDNICSSSEMIVHGHMALLEQRKLHSSSQSIPVPVVADPQSVTCFMMVDSVVSCGQPMHSDVPDSVDCLEFSASFMREAVRDWDDCSVLLSAVLSIQK